MGVRLKAPFVARVGGGGVLTFIGTSDDQAVFWFLEAIDPRPGEGPWPSVGRLQRPRYRVSPIRFGTGFCYGIRIAYGDAVRWHSVSEVNSGVTFTDASKHATNIYLAPKRTPLIRYGMHYKFGEIKYGEGSGLYDRVTVKAVLD